ncbi:MAG: hypothetical protein U0271_38105 [Polyangiaceae bacterium]
MLTCEVTGPARSSSSTELSEVGRAATQAGGQKIAAGDARIADLLSIDRRFGALRAPPASGEPTTARVPISRRLARLCREFALVHPSPLETEEFRARDDAGKVTLDFYPGSTAYGLEPVVRWTIVTDLAWVRRAGAGQETSALATELRIDPSADLARATLEKVVARLVLDGAVKHRFHGSVRALADAITPACSEIARAPTRAELERALDTGLAAIRTNPEVYHVRADEIRWALAEPLPDPSTACPTKRSKPGVPALATYPHAELFLEALRTPSPSLIVRVRAVGLAGRPFQRRLTGMPFARLLEDVIPFLRSGEPVEIDPNHLVFQFALRDKEMFVEVPIAAVRAIPALNKLLAPSPPPTEGHARATSATPSSTGRPRSVTIAWRRGDAECTAHAHDSGVAWVDERANGLSVQRVVTRLEPALIHRMVRATVERGAAPAWVARRMRRLALEAS